MSVSVLQLSLFSLCSTMSCGRLIHMFDITHCATASRYCLQKTGLLCTQKDSLAKNRARIKRISYNRAAGVILTNCDTLLL